MRKSEVADPEYANAIHNAFNAGRLEERNNIIRIISNMKDGPISNNLGACVWTRHIINLINDDVEQGGRKWDEKKS